MNTCPTRWTRPAGLILVLLMVVLAATGCDKEQTDRPHMTIAVQNPGEALTDYQVRVLVPYDNRMRADWGDLRFVDKDGGDLPYWIESRNAAGAIVWVRLPKVASGRSWFFLLFGDALAESASDGEATFLFFDDFEDGFRQEKWLRNAEGGDGKSGAYVRDGCMVVQGGDNLAPGWMSSEVDLPSSVTVMSRMRCVYGNQYSRGGFMLIRRDRAERQLELDEAVTGVEYNYYAYKETASPNADCFAPLPHTKDVKLDTYIRDKWFRQTLSYDGTTDRDNVVYSRVVDDREQTITHSAARCDRPLRIHLKPWAWKRRPSHRISMDWIAVRRYAAEEPTTEVVRD